MAAVDILRSTLSYYDSKRGLIRIVKENGRTIFKSINGKVVLDFYAPIESRALPPSEYTARMIDPNNLTKAEEIMNTAKKLLKNKKVRIAVRTLTGLVTILVLTTTALPATPVLAAAPGAVETLAGAKEIEEVTRFIRLIINTIRVLAVSICGLISANTGLKLLTEENTDGPKEAKKSFQKILWALFLVFAGTGLASLLARKLLTGGF